MNRNFARQDGAWQLQLLERKGNVGQLGRIWCLGAKTPSISFFKIAPFTLAINMASAIFYTSSELEKYETSIFGNKESIFMAMAWKQ